MTTALSLRPETLPFTVDILSGHLSPSSLAMYRRDFAAYCTFAQTAQAALNPATLARWRTSMASETTLSPNTINRMLSAVKRLMQQAAEQGYLSFEMAEAFHAIRGVRVVALRARLRAGARTWLTPQQMRVLCEHPDVRTPTGVQRRALFAVMASSGARVSEVATLTRQQIMETSDGYFLRLLGKNEEQESLAPLSTEAYTLVMRWLALRGGTSDYIFTPSEARNYGSTHEHISTTAVWKAVTTVAAQLGIEHVKPHDFRRFVGTQLARRDLQQARLVLRHKRIETTIRAYVQPALEAGLTNHLY